MTELYNSAAANLICESMRTLCGKCAHTLESVRTLLYRCPDLKQISLPKLSGPNQKTLYNSVYTLFIVCAHFNSVYTLY